MQVWGRQRRGLLSLRLASWFSSVSREILKEHCVLCCAVLPGSELHTPSYCCSPSPTLFSWRSAKASEASGHSGGDEKEDLCFHLKIDSNSHIHNRTSPLWKRKGTKITTQAQTSWIESTFLTAVIRPRSSQFSACHPAELRVPGSMEAASNDVMRTAPIAEHWAGLVDSSRHKNWSTPFLTTQPVLWRAWHIGFRNQNSAPTKPLPSNNNRYLWHNSGMLATLPSFGQLIIDCLIMFASRENASVYAEPELPWLSLLPLASELPIIGVRV